MTNHRPFRWSVAAAIAIACFCFFYTLCRAEKLSMTCDEAYTYQIFHGNSDPLHTANHHILNTYMMRAFSIVFGESKFVLRSPNLVAHLLFLFFGYLILTRLKKQWLVIAAYLSLNLNPFLLEFFSLARGYGLSMGFMTAGLWMFLMHLEKQTDQQKKPIQFLYGAFICAALAVLSNFMMTYFYVGLLSLYFFMEVRKSSSPKKIVIHLKKNAGFYFLNFLFLIFVYRNVSVLNREHQLYYGGQLGFYSDTISSLVDDSLSEKIRYFNVSVIPDHFFSLAVVILFILATLTLLKSILVKQIKIDFSILFYLLSITCLLPVILWWLTGTLLPTNRTALVYYPLFILMLFFMLKELTLSQKKTVKIFSLVFSLFICSLLVANMAFSANFKNTTEWKYDANDENMIQALRDDVLKRHASRQVSLGVNWLFEASINYYREYKELTWLKPVNHNDYDTTSFDYFYIFADDSFHTASKIEIDTVKKFESTILLRKKTNSCLIKPGSQKE